MKIRSMLCLAAIILVVGCETVPVVVTREVAPAERLSGQKSYLVGVFYYEVKKTLLNPFPYDPHSPFVWLKGATGQFRVDFTSTTSSDVVVIEAEPGMYTARRTRKQEGFETMGVAAPETLAAGVTLEPGSIVYVGDLWLQRREMPLLNSIVLVSKFEYNLERCEHKVREEYDIPSEMVFR